MEIMESYFPWVSFEICGFFCFSLGLIYPLLIQFCRLSRDCSFINIDYLPRKRQALGETSRGSLSL